MLKLICIQTYHKHWATQSGYHHFLSRLPENIRVTHLRIPRRNVTNKDLRGMEKMWFRPVAHWTKNKINPWTTENDLLTELHLFKQVRKELKEGSKIIVHFLDGEIGYNVFGILRRFLGPNRDKVRLIASYHQPEYLLHEVLPHTKGIHDLDFVLTVGRSQFPFFDFLPEKRLHFVPHGINTDYFKPVKQSVEKKNQLHCLTVGHWLRDFDVLEQVICNAPERVVFRIVAGEEHVDRFSSRPNVELYSGISDDKLLQLYQDSDIGLVPLQDSTANNGLLEMMSCGLPIIATQVGSVTDYLPERIGILVKKNSPSSLHEAVIRLAESPLERKRLSEASRRRALELDWNIIAQQMTEIYSQA